MPRDGAGERATREQIDDRVPNDAGFLAEFLDQRHRDEQLFAERVAIGSIGLRADRAAVVGNLVDLDHRVFEIGAVAIARLPGRVHGVVVQITAAVWRSEGRLAVATGNRTQTVVDLWSWYSTSA